MSYSEYLRINPALEVELADSLKQIEDQAAENFSTMEHSNLLIMEIITLFHKAYKVDEKTFVDKIFFESQYTIRLTKKHQVYIYSEWDKLKVSSINEANDVQLVNLYRNIVSDMFDPYLSVIVACLKMVEHSFTSFLSSNLSASEFNKYQYASKRLKDSKLLRGYFPIIRNAVSHSGSHSIEYIEGNVIFKKLERSDNPKVLEILKVSTFELSEHIQSLIDFTTAIDVSINIFGLDISDFIKDHKDISYQFANKLASPEAFETWRKNCDDYHQLVWNDPDLKESEKQEHFARLFSKECSKKNMKAKQIIFKKDQLLLIEVLCEPINMEVNQEVINRAVELIKYCLLAEPFFHSRIKSYLVAELPEENEDSLQVWLQGNDLRDYSIHKANMYDLLHDGKIFKNEIDIQIQVDFNALDEIQFQSLDNTRKRKSRN